MKTIHYIILSFLIVTNTYAFDCKQLSIQLLNLPLKPKIQKLDGYKTLNVLGNEKHTIINFWKQDGKIQESIKMHYKNDTAFMVVATYHGYSNIEASNKLRKMISIVGKSNVKLRDGEPNPFYDIKCNEGNAASLFINELHMKKPISYIVNLFIRN